MTWPTQPVLLEESELPMDKHGGVASGRRPQRRKIVERLQGEFFRLQKPSVWRKSSSGYCSPKWTFRIISEVGLLWGWKWILQHVTHAFLLMFGRPVSPTRADTNSAQVVSPSLGCLPSSHREELAGVVLFHTHGVLLCCLHQCFPQLSFSPPAPKIAKDIADLDFPPKFVFHFERTQHGCWVLTQHQPNTGV